MSIWKNTEVRRTALWLLLATAVCSVAAALLYPICGLLTLGWGRSRGPSGTAPPAALPGTGGHESGH